MAKAQKPNVPKKVAQNGIQQRIKNLFAGQEPPTYMTIRQTEELKARLKELEAQIAKRQAEPLDQQPDTSQEVERLKAQIAQLKAQLEQRLDKTEPKASHVALPKAFGSASLQSASEAGQPSKARRPFLSLRTKLSILFSLIAIAVVSAITFIYYTNLKNQSLQEFRQLARTAAAIAALQQNGDEFEKISSAQDPLYEKFRVQNLKIRRSDPRFVYTFTVSKDDKGLYFVVDAGEPGEENIAAFGERYDDPSETLASNYDTMTEAIVEPDIYTDKYGSFLSAYAPIFTSDGRRVGVIGVDIDASTIVAKERQLLNQTLLILLVSSLISILLGFFFGDLLTKPIMRLVSDTNKLATGDFSFRTSVLTNDEVGELGRAFNLMAEEIQTFVAGLEQRVLDRTHDLELATEVGRLITEKVTNQYEMLKEAAELIRARFNLYYTQIYLVDASGRNLVLSAGTGEVGNQLMRRSHRLPIGLGSINGRAASEKQPIVIEDTEKSANFLPNPLLPLTRSEMSVPLVVGEKVVGVLDLQSEQPGALNEINLPAFKALAGQLAIAIQNASLFAQTEQARLEIEEQARRLTIAGWQEFLDGIQRSERIGFSYAQDEVIPLVEVDSAPTQDEGTFSVPIEMAGAKIGEIRLADEPGRAWTAQETVILRATAEQVAQHLENLRLLAEAKKYRSEAEQAVRRLTREGWEEYLQQTREMRTAFLYDGEKVSTVEQPEALESALSSDIKIRGETVGQLSILEAETETLSEEERELVASVTERLSAHLENLRLTAQTEQALAVSQKLAQREQALRQMTAAVRSSTNLETILRITARELGSLLGRRTLVQLTPPTREVSASPGNGDSPNQLA